MVVLRFFVVQQVNTSPPKTSKYCKRCTKDRMVPYKTSLAIMDELELERTPYGFRKVFGGMKENTTLPDTRPLVPMKELMRDMERLPWCSRLMWAKEVREREVKERVLRASPPHLCFEGAAIFQT
jgi:hypothetical protein